MSAWLNVCDKIEPLQPSRQYFDYHLKHCIGEAEDKERWPITFDSFKEYYPDLYETLKLSDGGGA